MATDYAISEYGYSMSAKILEKYTGFADGIYVSPARYLAMKNKMMESKTMELKEEELMGDE